MDEFRYKDWRVTGGKATHQHLLAMAGGHCFARQALAVVSKLHVARSLFVWVTSVPEKTEMDQREKERGTDKRTGRCVYGSECRDGNSSAVSCSRFHAFIHASLHQMRVRVARHRFSRQPRLRQPQATELLFFFNPYF